MLKQVVEAFKANEVEIQAWLDKKKAEVKGPIYNSVDLRNSGFKVGSVDTNIFPAGFNNVCNNYAKKATVLFKAYIDEHFKNAKKILIYPEAHTKNEFYIQNTEHLKTIVENAGYNVTVSMEINESYDLIISNNDFSGGITEEIKNTEIPVVPYPELGWFHRSKHRHQEIKETLMREAAEILNIDPWLLYPYSTKVEGIDFQEKTGFEKIEESAKKMFKKIQDKYDEYGIDKKPYLVMKNDAGTYGIGVHMIHNIEELTAMNRKTRNKMSTGKDKVTISNLIIEEGIETSETYKGYTAEPVIYLANNTAFGGFFRLNEDKDSTANLNSRGMKFTKLCFHEMFGYKNNFPGCDIECLLKLYFFVAEVASVASGFEALEVKQNTA